MSVASFQAFFRAATGRSTDPFDYQTRLACGDDGQGRACGSLLIDVPTGCGKTAAVVLAWLWNRVIQGRTEWPRRLVYCLPMRSLVEQTEQEVRKWLGEKLWDGKAEHVGKVGLHILMGGAEKTDWDLHPGQDAVLIGTQDMLLSRALNRGYGMSRARWPMAFGLLNHDCLWVFDETQLMGVGVETSAQLDGFRHLASLGAPTNTFTWWMSATLHPAQLDTVDHPKPSSGWEKIELEAPDLEPGKEVQTRRTARKRLVPAPVELPRDKTNYAKSLAGFVHKKHQEAVDARPLGQPGVLTLIVLNRVVRAREVYQALQKLKVPADGLALVHSRFRPGDRQRHEKILRPDKTDPAWNTDRIVVATQAVEAGIDVSARVLVTELAPWSSLVQRFGRCNRYGEWPEGTDVFWIDLRPKDDKDELNLPYARAELIKARELLEPLSDVGPQSLSAVTYQPVPEVRSVIRRKDLLDLFDTTADLLGHDLDVSRYVRDSEDTDVQVFWRDLSSPAALPLDRQPAPTRQEICRVSLSDFDLFLKKSAAYVWEALDKKAWVESKRVRPGQVYLLPVAGGGYDDLLGWTGQPDAKGAHLAPCPPHAGNPPDPYDGNDPSFLKRWLLLSDHTRDVVDELDIILRDTLPLKATEQESLRDAARWHDVGKAHRVFQDLLRGAVDSTKPDPACPDKDALWAKSAGTKRFVSAERKGFRHELASALARLQQAPGTATHVNLTAFLIAAHHGKVRLSIRSLPEETTDLDHPERLCARGVWNGDPLPIDAFPPEARGHLPAEGFKLDLGYMRMGDRDSQGPSWLARMLALRDSEDFGPFRLAYLETLLRAADMRASAEEAAS